MGIEATSSTSVSSTSAAAQSSAASSSDSAKKTSTDSSFKDEMNKVSKSESKKDDKKVEKSDDKVNAVSDKKDKEASKSDTNKTNDQDSNNLTLTGNVDTSNVMDLTKMGALNSLNNANAMLSSDIQQMINNTAQISGISGASKVSGSIFSFGDDSKNSISMTQSDAQFFINLTQNDTVSVQNAVVQAQNMINSGADVSDVQQNVKISQALLDAINNAKETNQPLRIDFDQNVSVVLRIGKDGAIAANFIPGDKAVEQYLRNNIESLKATFNENDLPYTDLSYSNSSKQQNERRRNKQQQGEQ